MHDKLFKRNIGFISGEDQKKISVASVGIAGAGGDGGLLAERLVRFGIGKVLLADPEVFTVDNANRQFGANVKNFGKNKAKAVSGELIQINPQLKTVVFNKGINKENLENFVKDADIVVDEIEYTNPVVSVMLSKEARKQNKFLFMGANIGWGASIFCFSPRGMTFEEYFRYNSTTKSIDLLQYIKKIPPYFDKQLLQDVLKGKKPIPSLSSSVGLVASFLSSEIIFFLLKKRKPIVVPRFLFVDTFEHKLEIR